MKALSIRQPWAWLIVRPDLTGQQRIDALSAGELKIIENRTWPTRYRGRVLIHASKGMTRQEYEDVADFVRDVNRAGLLSGGAKPPIVLPRWSALERGGIVGVATVTDCILPYKRTSPWHMQGCYGFALADAQPLPFMPIPGRLGLFDVPAEIAAEATRMMEMA